MHRQVGCIMDKTGLFAWVKTHLPKGYYTQPQVDALDTLLSVLDADKVAQALSSLNNWPLPADKGVINITLGNLKRVYPSVNGAALPIILRLAPQYGIVTRKQLCAFIANCLLESNGFNAKRESFNYRPNRLRAVFPTRVKSVEAARELLAKGQVATANFLYGGRYGNRPGTNDGWDYRGGGITQNTFRANYFKLQVATGIPFGENPKLIEDLEKSVHAAMSFWQESGCNMKAEKINLYANGYTLNTLNSRGVETRDYKMNYGARVIRETVNGGLNGYHDFCVILERCFRYL